MPEDQIIDCTYIIKLNWIDHDEDTEVTRELLQQYLGSGHEVLSASTVILNSSHTVNPSVIHHVVKVRTTAPSDIANKLMGPERWVRKDQVLFTSIYSS
mmetsp:Transcript_11433/g.16391  ORF Transcript_11433/g.16391 Transcript_11433/m.16391 type:complete len:99 (-) Transcript_11433:321-617(-)